MFMTLKKSMQIFLKLTEINNTHSPGVGERKENENEN